MTVTAFEPVALELRGPQLGKCERILPLLDDCSVDAVVTDPPYGIRFMGKAWDRAEISHAAKVEEDRKQRQIARGDMPMRLTGDRDGRGARKLTPRSASAFGNRSGEAGSYDFSRKGMLAFQGWCEVWGAELLRVLKPGGHAVVFGYPRTYHRLVSGLEDAGFEVRDTLLWLFGQGFPKSMKVADAIDKTLGSEPTVVGERENRGWLPRASDTVKLTEPSTDEGRAWAGWGTALKPAFEPILLARKPFNTSVARNVLEHGVGALNIDACRIPGEKGDGNWTGKDNGAGFYAVKYRREDYPKSEHEGGRWPATVLLDEAAAELLDVETGDRKAGGNVTGEEQSKPFGLVYGDMNGRREWKGYGDQGGPSRFFYCPKTHPDERHGGIDRELFPDGNDHPTVKPLEVMRWLLRLVTPADGLVLDPFLGSGTTACAAALEGHDFVGVDEDAHYLAIAEQRIAHWRAQPSQLELG